MIDALRGDPPKRVAGTDVAGPAPAVPAATYAEEAAALVALAKRDRQAFAALHDRVSCCTSAYTVVGGDAMMYVDLATPSPPR